jgi:hypothetical protein
MLVHDLKKQVRHRLHQMHPDGFDILGIKVPSENCIAYQLSPKHPLHDPSLNYTRALNIKHKVQARTLREYHPDSHYVASFFKMMERLGVSCGGIGYHKVYRGRRGPGTRCILLHGQQGKD